MLCRGDELRDSGTYASQNRHLSPFHLRIVIEPNFRTTAAFEAGTPAISSRRRRRKIV
jgi:hypothetical protein